MGEEVGRRARTCSLSISSSSQLADVSRSMQQELEPACVAEASEVEGKTHPLKHGKRRRAGVAALRKKVEKLTWALLPAELALERDIEPKVALMSLVAPVALPRSPGSHERHVWPRAAPARPGSLGHGPPPTLGYMYFITQNFLSPIYIYDPPTFSTPPPN